MIIREDLAAKIIEVLCALDKNDLADELQFGLEGLDDGDKHRCQLCTQLCGGDIKHRCENLQ